MLPPGLDIVTLGWEQPGSERTFYPDDLPLDRHLTYFANEIPAEIWLGTDSSLLRTRFETLRRRWDPARLTGVAA